MAINLNLDFQEFSDWLQKPYSDPDHYNPKFTNRNSSISKAFNMGEYGTRQPLELLNEQIADAINGGEITNTEKLNLQYFKYFLDKDYPTLQKEKRYFYDGTTGVRYDKFYYYEIATVFSDSLIAGDSRTIKAIYNLQNKFHELLALVGGYSSDREDLLKIKKLHENKFILPGFASRIWLSHDMGWDGFNLDTSSLCDFVEMSKSFSFIMSIIMHFMEGISTVHGMAISDLMADKSIYTLDVYVKIFMTNLVDFILNKIHDLLYYHFEDQPSSTSPKIMDISHGHINIMKRPDDICPDININYKGSTLVLTPDIYNPKTIEKLDYIKRGEF